MTFMKPLLGAACAAALCLGTTLPASADMLKMKHVLLLSVDGMHEIDLANFIKANPDSTMAKLETHGTHFSAASSASLLTHSRASWLW